MVEIKVKLTANYLHGVNKSLEIFGLKGYEVHADGDFLVWTITADDKILELPHKEYLELEEKMLNIIKEETVGKVIGGVKIVDAEIVR